MQRSRFEPSQFNQSVGRPPVSDMARGLPDSHILIGQLMAQEDIAATKVKYAAPSQVGASGIIPSTTVAVTTTTGFIEQGILLDSAVPNGDLFYSSPSTFADGTIIFQMPKLVGGYSLSDTVGFRLAPFYIPQPREDVTIHPDYLYAQKIYIRISEATGATSNYQPIRGDGATFVCTTSPVANSGSVLVTPTTDIVTFQKPISSISQLTVTFYRPSAVPSLYNLERLLIPKTNIITKFDHGLGRFYCIDGDKVSNFVNQAAYTATDKFAVYVTPIIPVGLAWSLPPETVQFGWYADNLDYVNNTFTINGLTVPLAGYDPSINFVITIMPNRINLDLTAILKVGAKTNDLTFTA